MSLKLEKRELLLELMRFEGFEVLISELDVLVQQQEYGIIKLSVTDEASQRELLSRKLRAEGARQLYHAFVNRMKGLKAKQKS